MKNKTKKKISIMIFLIMIISIFSVFSLTSAEWQYDISVVHKTSFVGHTNNPNIGSISQQFSLDTPQICNNITVLMRNTYIAPVAFFAMDIYTYNNEYDGTENTSPLGELIAQSTNYFDNSDFKISNSLTNFFDIETWNLTTFKFDSISLDASTFYVFSIRYTGAEQVNIGSWTNTGYNCTDIALINAPEGGYQDGYQYWRYVPYTTDNYYNAPYMYHNNNLAIPWVMNQERVVSSEDITFTFEPFSHGRVFYKVSGGNNFPPTGAGVDVGESGEEVVFNTDGYVFLYAVADEGYFFSGMNITGIDGYNLPSGYCVSKEESRNISVSFIELPEGVPDGYTLVIASDKGAGVNYFVDDDIGYIEPSLWENTTNYVRLSNVPFNSQVYVYAVAEQDYEFQFWSISENYIDTGTYEQYGYTEESNPFIYPSDYFLILFYFNGTAQFYEIYTSISLDADWIGDGTPPPEPTTGTDATPTPTPTLDPNTQRTFTILEFLFGDDGLLGEGFGLLVILICIIPCIVFAPFRNLWGFLAFFNVGVIITLATELLPIWVLILLVLLDIAVILRNRLSGGGGDE